MSIVTNFFKDSFWTIGAQGVSLLTSVIVSFVLPKFISVEEFGYWQYFLLWASYVGVMHFGYGDGIYLKLGGKYWNTLKKEKLSQQILLVTLSQIFIATIIIIAAYTFCNQEKYLIIFLWTALYLVIENTYKIITMAMMATDQIPFVSKTVIIDKLLMSALVVLLMIIHIKDACYVMLAYTAAHLVACLMILYKSKLFTNVPAVNKECLNEVLLTCKVGITLMLANFVSILIMGLCRIAVERYWNIETFSKLSFSITIASFLLVFISQIGYVLFPILKRMTKESQSILFEKIDFVMTLLPIVLYILFFAMYFFVKFWLPKYDDSLRFLAFTAPCICYETRVVLLYNTYFKNMGKIKQLLYINIICVVCSIVLYALAISLYDIDMMALSILIAEMVKIYIMQKYLYKEYTLKIESPSIVELVNTIGFVICFYYFGIYIALIWYIIIMCIIISAFKNKTLSIIESTKKYK